MKCQQPLLVACAIGLMALNAAGSTNDIAATEAAYSAITAHPLFNLKPAATTGAETPASLVPPKITLTGIMSILGPVQVLFKVNAPGLANPTAGQDTYVLGEGQSRDNIKVCHIDAQTERVVFDNHGVRQELSLNGAENDQTIFVTNTPPATETNVHPADFERSRTPDYLGGGSDPLPPGEAFRNQTQDERILMIEAQRAYYKSRNDPRADLLPATAMTPTDDDLPTPN